MRLSVIALVLFVAAGSHLLRARPAEAAGPAACFAQCDLAFYQCIPVYGGMGDAIAFCNSLKLDCYQDCIQLVNWIVANLHFFTIAGGGDGDPDDPVADTVLSAATEASSIYQAGLDDARQRYADGLERTREALHSAQQARLSPDAVAHLQGLVTAGEALVEGLVGIVNAQCYLADALGLEQPAAHGDGRFVLSEVGAAVRSDRRWSRQGAEGQIRTLLRAAERSYDRGDRSYRGATRRALQRLQRSERALGRLVRQGVLDARDAARINTEAETAAEIIRSGRSIRACF